MKILFLSHEIPSPATSDTLPLYHLIRHLSALYGHEITLVTFSGERARAEDLEHLKIVCSIEPPVSIQWDARDKLFFKAFKNGILSLPKNMKHGLLVNELDYYYDHRMDRMIRETIEKNNFEVVFSTRQMANYVVAVNVAKIVQPFDALSEWHKQVLANSGGLRRIVNGIRYALNRSYEKRIYEKFDACLVVTQRDKELLESLNPRIRCVVIPNGVDIDYFSPVEASEGPCSLIILAGMRGPVAVANVIYFYREVFPLILRRHPNVRLYLVGRDPSKEVSELSADPLVTVTGYVPDVRPYIEKSTVFVSPEVLGTGIKNKVLEAMSMGKAVVTTTLGAQGIAVTNREHLVIADTPEEFAKETASLLSNQRKRAALGTNARKLVVQQYSWKTVTQVLNELLVNISTERG